METWWRCEQASSLMEASMNENFVTCELWFALQYRCVICIGGLVRENNFFTYDFFSVFLWCPLFKLEFNYFEFAYCRAHL